MDAKVDQFATALLDARRSRHPIAGAEADRLATAVGREGAFKVQQAVCNAIGTPVAWKASPPSATSEAMMAPVMPGTLRPSGATYTAQELFACGIEIEIAFRIDKPLPSPTDSDFETALRAAVTPVVVIEVVDGRTEGFVDRAPLAKLADNQINGGLVIAEPTGGAVDLSNPEVKLTLGGEVVVDGRTAVPGGDAFASLLALAGMVGDHCGGVKPGQYVTTGALGGLFFVTPGTDVEGWIDGLGSVRMTFA